MASRKNSKKSSIEEPKKKYVKKELNAARNVTAMVDLYAENVYQDPKMAL